MSETLNILMIEDNPGDVRLVRETLTNDRRWPFRLVSEGRLADGVRRLESETFDMVLLDLGLPDGRGLATFEDVQSHAPAVPIVVLTGSDDQDTAVQAIHEGAQDFLVKGRFDADRLWRAIRYGIERKRSEAAQRVAFERLGQIEELKVANQLKLKLISEATHELNTPLTPLKLQLHMLKAGDFGPLNDKQERAVNILDRNLDRLRALLSDLLDVARLQNGRLVLRRTPIEATQLLKEVVETFDAAARRADIRLELAVGPPVQVWGDDHRLTQVVVNYISNALKFTPAGGRIHVELQRRGSDAVVLVSDSGLGLTPEQIGRLFAPFSQVHDASRTHTNGTGLGLYICKGIMEQHGGKAWCESDGPGRGSTFCFSLPVPDKMPMPPPMTGVAMRMRDVGVPRPEAPRVATVAPAQ